MLGLNGLKGKAALMKSLSEMKDLAKPYIFKQIGMKLKNKKVPRFVDIKIIFMGPAILNI